MAARFLITLAFGATSIAMRSNRMRHRGLRSGNVDIGRQPDDFLKFALPDAKSETSRVS